MHGYVSDLGADTQPYAWLFQGVDGFSGLSLVLLAVAVVRQARRTALWVAGAMGLAAFGVCAVADSLLPLDCSTWLSRSCKEAEHAGRLSWQHQSHAYSSVGTIIAAITSMVLLPLAGRTTAGWSRLWRWWWPGAVLTTVIAVRCAAWELGSGPGGLAQRIMLVQICAWIATVSALVLRSARAADTAT